LDVIERILNHLDTTRAKARHEVDHPGSDPPQLDSLSEQTERVLQAVDVHLQGERRESLGDEFPVRGINFGRRGASGVVGKMKGSERTRNDFRPPFATDA